MSLVLHREFADGSVEHSEFSRESWASAMRDTSLSRFWGHPPGDCCLPRLGRQGGESTVVEVPRSIEWPPRDLPMTPHELSKMTTLCVDDARDVLNPRRKNPPREGPHSDGRGQLLMF